MRRLSLALAIVCGMCSAAAAADTYLFDALKKPAYAKALKDLFAGSRKLPDWTRQMLKPKGNYVSGPATHESVAGTRYELFFACKAHDCGANKMQVMFSPNGARAWGAIVIEGKPAVYLGGPNPAQRQVLDSALKN